MDRTSFNIGNNLLLHSLAFKSEATRIYRRTHDLTDTSVPYECESRWNVIESFAMSCPIQSYQDSKHEPKIRNANPKI